jgi:NAD(P)-dependent dehydrogenase (short-subunit alcohol dehydrogenase family)
MTRPLDGKVALVAGATRGAGRGIACMLGAAGAVVYCSGRTGAGQTSPMGRKETIEETDRGTGRRSGRHGRAGARRPHA